MDAASRHPGWWGDQQAATRPRSIVELIAAGTLDAELAALLWLLAEARVPLVVAGPPRSGRTTVLTALLDFLPAADDVRILVGDAEGFEWLPEAARLGWRSAASADAGSPVARMAPADPRATVMLAGRLGGLAPDDLRGRRLRTAVRALSIGYGLAATIDGGSLEDVFERLGAPDAGLTGDELSHLGVVLVVRHVASGGVAPDRRRVVAAHYVRPLSRDAGGHVQRLAPAVLATWNAPRDAFEHFAWGILPELADRVGRRSGDFEADQAGRVEFLAGLVATGVTDRERVRRAIAGFRTVSALGGADRTHAP